MPQFDILTIGAQVFGFLFTLLMFYYYSITKAIPFFTEIKKLRKKKLVINKASLNETLTSIHYYPRLIQKSYIFPTQLTETEFLLEELASGRKTRLSFYEMGLLCELDDDTWDHYLR